MIKDDVTLNPKAAMFNKTIVECDLVTKLKRRLLLIQQGRIDKESSLCPISALSSMEKIKFNEEELSRIITDVIKEVTMEIHQSDMGVEDTTDNPITSTDSDSKAILAYLRSISGCLEEISNRGIRIYDSVNNHQYG